MYPTLIRIGSFEITTFGLLMFLAFVAGGWILARQFRRYGLDEELASTIVMFGAIGGIIGAKVYYAILFRDWHLLFDRAGLVWYGGLIGGFIACSIVVIRRKAPYFTVTDAAAPAMAIGYAIGRLGCFMVGDDYGRPTDAWFGVAFPKGAPPTTARSLREFGVNIDPSISDTTVLRVHPTQIYESLSALVMFGILMWMAKRRHGAGTLFAAFLIMLGIERFFVEMVRAKDDRFFGPLTVAQIISIVLVVAGTWLFFARSREKVSA
jgi:phosphatidylglycerol---prolipoprotein diacylglyceryl transferase